MKKIFLIGFFLLSACSSLPEGQRGTPGAIPVLDVTPTRFIPTPVNATVPPTDVPSPVPTPTPLPPERYFTEDFNSKLDYWSTLFASGDSSEVGILNDNGMLTFDFNSPNSWLYAIYGAFNYESVHIETRVEMQGSNLNAIGLVCNYDEQEGWYEFNISSDGSYNLLHGQWLADEIARYTPILNATSEYIETGNSANEIGLDCYENIVQLYVNGKVIRKMDVAHIGLTGGKVGLSIASFEEVPVIVSFDWVKVSKP